MFKLLATAIAFFSLQANANTIDFTKFIPLTDAGIEFVVGDSTDHNLIGTISGKMHTFVREEVAEGFWVQSDIDAGFMGKVKMERLHDKGTGQITKLLVNGQEQPLPDPSEIKIIETKKDRITVPKGTFDCFYIKAKNTKNNQDQEVWLGAKEVPMGGMIKTVSQTQFGPMTLELTDYKKN